ncbi:hypothetical protein [Clostridium felsineum]|uniref:hypothetical protein n=1 Tax=Clostridium felsineum TaxID=36839 RepID=UPI00098CD900|nr:hypothetical protein [Clostridium felsineum]
MIASCDESAVPSEIDDALALGNMSLAASCLSIDSYWIHSLRNLFSSKNGKSLNEALKIPNTHKII